MQSQFRNPTPAQHFGDHGEGRDDKEKLEDMVKFIFERMSEELNETTRNVLEAECVKRVKHVQGYEGFLSLKGGYAINCFVGDDLEPVCLSLLFGSS